VLFRSVGEAAELESRWLLAGDATFVSGRTPADGLRLGVKVRYRARQAAAVFTQSPGEPGAGPGFRLEFEAPQRAAAPGQAAVLYDGPEVVGGGIILTSESREKALLALRRPSPGDKDHS